MSRSHFSNIETTYVGSFSIHNNIEEWSVLFSLTYLKAIVCVVDTALGEGGVL